MCSDGALAMGGGTVGDEQEIPGTHTRLNPATGCPRTPSWHDTVAPPFPLAANSAHAAAAPGPAGRRLSCGAWACWPKG